jgi:hypothetical protein
LELTTVKEGENPGSLPNQTLQRFFDALEIDEISTT